MAEAKIRWTQRVLGRYPGDIERVEIDTDLMRSILKAGRAEVLETYAPVAPRVVETRIEPAVIEELLVKHEEEVQQVIEAEKPVARKRAPKPAPDLIDAAGHPEI